MCDTQYRSKDKIEILRLLIEKGIDENMKMISPEVVCQQIPYTRIYPL